MPIRTGAAAPYAPPATVLQVIAALRDRGLTTPITSEVLLRAGISDSLVPRTLRTLTGLELIDEEGRLTPAMDALRRAPSADFQTRLAEHVRAVYEEVFQFTDPAKDDSKRIADAFRVYEPIGQRGRMVTLFLGLCEAAGLIPEGMARKSGPASAGAPARKNSTPKRPADRPKGDSSPQDAIDNSPSVNPALGGLLRLLPAKGKSWTQQERDHWMRLFGGILDYVHPPREASLAADSDDADYVVDDE
jgi:hypothetical protein